MADLPADLVDEVLDRFGLGSRPDTDPDGLASLYRAWGRSVPFDNTRKLLALHGDDADAPLPGMDAEDLLRTWLRHGTGGTCFPSANALHELARACGFDSRLVMASMWDLGTPTHGTTVVTIDDSEWLIDSSMLTEQPLRLPHGAPTAIDHPVFATTAEAVESGWLILFPMGVAETQIPCRTLSPDAVSHADFVARFEASRQESPFNGAPSVRRNDASGVTSIGGGMRFRRTAAGVEETALTGDALFAALRDEVHLSEEIVDRLAAVLATDE